MSCFLEEGRSKTLSKTLDKSLKLSDGIYFAEQSHKPGN